MFYILTYNTKTDNKKLETFDLDEISKLIDDLVLNQIDFTLVAFKH